MKYRARCITESTLASGQITGLGVAVLATLNSSLGRDTLHEITFDNIEAADEVQAEAFAKERFAAAVKGLPADAIRDPKVEVKPMPEEGES